jgi:hypothetical protein
MVSKIPIYYLSSDSEESVIIWHFSDKKRKAENPSQRSSSLLESFDQGSNPSLESGEFQESDPEEESQSSKAWSDSTLQWSQPSPGSDESHGSNLSTSSQGSAWTPDDAETASSISDTSEEDTTSQGWQSISSDSNTGLQSWVATTSSEEDLSSLSDYQESIPYGNQDDFILQKTRLQSFLLSIKKQ